jgi:CRP-like cAMP-binding protein
VDLLERARTLMACPLFEGLAPAVLIRLAERARPASLERGERRTTDDTVWVVASGSLAVAVREAAGPAVDATASLVRKRGAGATAGHALGVIRVVRPATPAIEVVAEQPSTLVGLGFDDVRDVLEEDPAALAAIADRLAALLLGGAP